MTYRYEPEPAEPRWRTPVLVVGVIALAVVAGFLLALVLGQNPGTGSGDPTPTPIPSAPASEEPEPSTPPTSDQPEPSGQPSQPAPSERPDPTPVVLAPDGVLPPGGIARVIVDALRVRETPTTSAPEVLTILRGDYVVIGPSVLYPGFGPTDADGFTWVSVRVLDLDELPAPGGDPLPGGMAGWVAVGDGDQAWLEAVAPRCTDAEPTLQLLASMTEWEHLACYGDRSLTLEGVLGCGGCGGLTPGSFEPSWLAHPNNYDFLSVEPQDRIGPFRVFFSPDGPARPDEPGVAPILRMTGHFDDPAASTCEITTGDPVEIDTVIAQLYCRGHFVVETYEIIGVDEDFPFG